MTVDFSKLRLLIVDDQMLVRSLISQSMQGIGVKADHVSQAADGTLAMRTLDIRQVDVVLCDVQMQPMNGMDLLKELRCGHTANPSNLPFVFLSGHADRNNVILAGQLHADGFVVKPPKPADVEKALIVALQRQRPDVDPFAYYAISTGTDYDRKVFGRLFEVSVQPSPEHGVAMWLDEVKPGALLAQDLRSRNGHLLLPHGARVSAGQLAALRDYSNRYGVTRLFIAEEEPASGEASHRAG